MAATSVFYLNAARERSQIAPACWLNASGSIGDIVAEIYSVYGDLSMRATERGLSIPTVNASGFPINLMLLEGGTYYVSLGLAEFEVHGRQLALDFALLACSRSSRLRITEIGGHVRDWCFELKLHDEWRCVHRGGFLRFAPWRLATQAIRVNERPVPTSIEASRRRVYGYHGMSGTTGCR